MKHVTLTSKGQFTVPAEIRQALGLRTGDHLLLQLTEDGFSAVVTRRPSVADVQGLFRHAARPGVTRAEERAAFEASAGQREHDLRRGPP